jgi:hypothetical protein
MPIDPRVQAVASQRSSPVRECVLCERDGMSLLLLEALLALVILIAIVWWTMFAGRHKGEIKAPEASDARAPQDTDKP